MSIELRAITEDEYLPFVASLMSTFGDTPNPERSEVYRKAFEYDRSVAAFDGTRIVGTSGIESYNITLPGLNTVPAAGVSMVTVSPTHRRRGILTSMMDRMLDDSHARGEPVAMLLSSESSIYGRYGFGLATHSAALQMETAYSSFAHHPEFTGSVDLIDKEKAAEMLPPFYERFRVGYPGCLTRDAEWWDIFLLDQEHHRDGASDRRYAVYTAGSGEIDGYAAYRIKGSWENGFPNGKLMIGDFITATAEARAALWQFCLSVDLISTVEVESAPVDDPLHWMMADPRRLRRKRLEDFLWIRPLDIPKALSARRYAIEGKIVFQIDDAFRPATSGRYVLEGGPDGAQCKGTRNRPDLSMGVSDLGAAYLGGVTLSTLARAGRVEECTPGALRRADLMFSSDPLPWCSTEF
jgi:predicted acetyltransferase